MLASSDRRRFRSGEDWFVVSTAGTVVCTVVGATAERTVDLLHALSVHLDPAVDVRISDVRTGRCWAGNLRALPEVRDAIGRLRLPLAAYGGVEVCLFTGDDQLTVTPELLLVIYARSDRWSDLLNGMGLVKRAAAPPPTWTPTRAVLQQERPLLQALEAAAARLTLSECAP